MTRYKDPFRLRLSCLILALIMILMPLTGCTSCSEFIQNTEALRYFHQPQLASDSDHPWRVKGGPHIDEMNQTLDAYFTPVAAIVSAADADEKLFSIEYTYSGDSGVYTLSSAIVSRIGSRIELPDVIVKRGGVELLANMPDLSLLDDPLYAAGVLFLNDIGLPADRSKRLETLSCRELLELYMNVYYAMTDCEVDISHFSADIGYSDFCKTAMVLGLTPYVGDYIDSEHCTVDTATCYDLVNCSRGLLQALFRDYSGVSSRVVSRSDAYDLTQMIMGLYSDNPFMFDSWGEFRDRISASDLYSVPEGKLSRQSFATMWRSMYEQLFGEMRHSLYDTELTDTEDDDCVLCCNASLMSNFPSGSAFSPEYYVHMDELPKLCTDFTDQCYMKWTDMHDYDIPVDCTERDAICGLFRIADFNARFGKADGGVKRVINDRSYDWYASQYNTGKYAGVNCMPTITHMAAEWFYGEGNGISVEDLRDYYLPDSKDGWYMYQVVESLKRNNIDCEEVEFDTDDEITETICRELDKGHIVLSQMSEAEPGESGHCFVIYGYIRCGDSIRFMLHDPGVYDGTDDRGLPPGKAMCLDSGYASWIISRITWLIVSVG